MRKMLMVMLLLVVSTVGCSKNENNNLKWHSTKQGAIDAGLKEDGGSTENIIDDVTVDGETFFLYTVDDVVFVANMAEKNGKYAWYRANPGATVNNVSQVSLKTSTYSKKTYNVYMGAAEKPDGSITIYNGGTVTPTVKNGMFYYIEYIKD